MMWYWGSGVHWWGWVIGVVLTVAFWAMVVWAIWYFVDAATGRSRERANPVAPHPRATALHILEERLARGEIDVEEFEHRREALLRPGAAHEPAGDRPHEAGRPSGSAGTPAGSSRA